MSCKNTARTNKKGAESEDDEEIDEFTERIQRWSDTAKSNWKFRPSHQNVMVSTVKKHDALQVKITEDKRKVEEVENSLVAWQLATESKKSQQISDYQLIDETQCLEMKLSRRKKTQEEIPNLLQSPNRCNKESDTNDSMPEAFPNDIVSDGSGNKWDPSLSIQPASAVIAVESHGQAGQMTETVKVKESIPKPVAVSKFVLSKFSAQSETMTEPATICVPSKISVLKRHNSFRDRMKKKDFSLMQPAQDIAAPGSSRHVAFEKNSQSSSTTPEKHGDEETHNNGQINDENGLREGNEALLNSISPISTGREETQTLVAKPDCNFVEPPLRQSRDNWVFKHGSSDVHHNDERTVSSPDDKKFLARKEAQEGVTAASAKVPQLNDTAASFLHSPEQSPRKVERRDMFI